MRTKWGEAAVRFAPAALGLLLGLLALGPALGPGFVLRYDMVFVPDPPLAPPGAGFPRAVPSDLVVALLAQVAPAQVVQKAVLLGIFVLAASGAAALVPSDRLGPRLAAAAFYAWNTYLAQRLLLGQWALLLGVAGLPWAVRAVVLGGRLRLVAALLPAAVGGFQAMLVSALTVLATAATAATTSAATGGKAAAVAATAAVPAGPVVRARRTAEAGAVLAALSLPWLVPALLSGASTDPAGAVAFAARADGPFGTVGSLLSLGGIWNVNAVVPGQQAWWSASVRLVLAAVAVWGFTRLRGGFTRPGGTGPRRTTGTGRADGPCRVGVPYWTGLATAAGAGLGVALLGAFAPGLLGGLIAWWPGFGPLRDGQLYVAPLVLLQAVGLAGAVARWDSRAVAAVAAAVPVLVLPTFALGAFGRLAAVDYPGEWRRVQAIVNADPAPGALLSLPWGAHRAFAWNGGRVVLDPATKMFARPVIWNDALLVGLPGGGRLRLAAESPQAAAVEAALRAAPDGRARALAKLGIRYVLERANDNKFYGSLVVFQGSELRLLRLSGVA
ncbi:membrane protein [Streptosporangium fragile]|uniref:Membrane protein n=1 Tax=Streptosporangium fragile TaxID=46186 RepID=A0ABP6IKH0_9ACTN